MPFPAPFSILSTCLSLECEVMDLVSQCHISKLPTQLTRWMILTALGSLRKINFLLSLNRWQYNSTYSTRCFIESLMSGETGLRVHSDARTLELRLVIIEGRPLRSMFGP